MPILDAPQLAKGTAEAHSAPAIRRPTARPGRSARSPPAGHGVVGSSLQLDHPPAPRRPGRRHRGPVWRAARPGAPPSPGRHLSQRGEEPANDERGESERQLVDEQQPRARCQRAGEHDHLLLASGQEPGLAVEQRFELGEQLKGGVDTAGAEREVRARRQLRNTARSSVMKPSPRRARRCNGPAQPLDRHTATSPFDGSTPPSANMVVVFPAPFGPSRVHRAHRLSHPQVDAVHDRHVAVADGQAAGPRASGRELRGRP